MNSSGLEMRMIQGRGSDYMKNKVPMRVRISRFLDERYAQMEQPPYFAELALFGIIVVVAVWPILSLAAAMQIVR